MYIRASPTHCIVSSVVHGSFSSRTCFRQWLIGSRPLGTRAIAGAFRCNADEKENRPLAEMTGGKALLRIPYSETAVLNVRVSCAEELVVSTKSADLRSDYLISHAYHQPSSVHC